MRHRAQRPVDARLTRTLRANDWRRGISPEINAPPAVLPDLTQRTRTTPAHTGWYASGLASGGVRVPIEQLDLAIDVALTLRFAGFSTQIHRGGDNLAAMVEAISGRPFSEARSAWTALAHYLTPAAERALASVGA
mgnify:CR=1 FL=1